MSLRVKPVPPVSLEKVCEAVGIKRVRSVDAGNLKEIETALKEELAAEEPSVIICRKPCQLLKYVKPKPALSVDADKCRGCKSCMRIGCPAVKFASGKAEIDSAQCVGCGLCSQMCAFGAIGEGKHE